VYRVAPAGEGEQENNWSVVNIGDIVLVNEKADFVNFFNENLTFEKWGNAKQ